MRKTCFEVLPSSQNAQEMCRNDFRTGLKSFIFIFFFEIFNILDLRSDLGIFEILDQKMCRGRDLYRGYDPVGGRGH